MVTYPIKPYREATEGGLENAVCETHMNLTAFGIIEIMMGICNIASASAMTTAVDIHFETRYMMRVEEPGLKEIEARMEHEISE